MEQKTKFIIIGLIGFSAICLFLFLQATGSQQLLTRERNELKSENTTLTNKLSKLENELNGNKEKINSLRDERNKAAEDLSDLQKKFELATKTRDELMEKLKSQRQQPVVPQQEIVLQNTDAYWGAILKAKTDLEMQLASIRGELRNLQISNESLQRDKSTLELNVNSLRNEKQDLLRQLDYNQKLLDSISQEVVRERNDKVKIQDNYKTIKNENAVFIRQLESLNSRKSVLDRKIQELKVGKDVVEKRLTEMETMLTERISQINSLKDELDAIRSGKPSAALESKPKESVELPAIVVRSTTPDRRETVNDAPVFSGKILAVNPDNNFVVIDLGISSGVKRGDAFSVYREGKSIGSIRVIQVRDNISACDIETTTTSLKIGDSIK
jgi:predicted  nucleic acid-binding Zn-ribbon protein